MLHFIITVDDKIVNKYGSRYEGLINEPLESGEVVGEAE
jgi:hypothetical protein